LGRAERRSTAQFRGIDWLGHSHNSWNQFLADDGDSFHKIAVIPARTVFQTVHCIAQHGVGNRSGDCAFVMSSSISRMRIAVLAMARQSDVLPSSMDNSSSVQMRLPGERLRRQFDVAMAKHARRGLTVGAPYPIFPAQSPSGGMVDATDSKSVIRKGVLVRVRPGAPFAVFAKYQQGAKQCGRLGFFSS
jgi:hypothetical protein